VKFIFFAQGGVDPSVVAQRLHDFAAAHPGSITAIEGPNEVNNFPVTIRGFMVRMLHKPIKVLFFPQ
jgi:hypothetical protein